MMRICLLYCFLVLSSLQLFAQQDAQYTGYMFNTQVYNPAYTGSRGVPSVLAYYRQQWLNINTAPQSLALSFQSPIKDKNMALGFHVESDWIGVHNRLSAFASYAYIINTNKGNIALGLQAGLLNTASNFSKVETLDGYDPIYDSDVDKLSPNFGAGIYYYSDLFYIGASVPHLLNQDISVADAKQSRHYFFTTGFLLSPSKNFRIKPSVLVKVVPNEAPVSVDATVNFIIHNALWLGVSHRWKESVSFLAQYQINKNLRLGYAYDYPLSKLYNWWGTHDFFIGYEWGFSNDRVLTPRYF
ncbi:MAG: type IX secretion system membrane protein PorP/SprF [Chitinophagales bacterium]|nr:type IX secretion system membrane protein PorP/SprF [Bacteroidota bacterium]MCB9042221.1 type IX secretion system membrane protein PorP/SprF [Chitinophagales bacterium]